ncbi:MAG: thioredoxin family protein [Planctomycetota bacterium]
MENESQGERPTSSSVLMKVGIVVVLIAVVGFVIYQKGNNTPEEAGQTDLQVSDTERSAEQESGRNAQSIPADTTETEEEVFLPSLVDLGSDKCVPCKMMAPILEELKEEYKGIFDVEFINTREDQTASSFYNIRLIPTQIFYDAEGNELFRHEGFFSKEDILAKWKELGISLEKKPE